MQTPFAAPAPGGAASDPGGRDYEDARLQLARISVAPGATWRQVLQEVIEVAARVIAVERVSVWWFLDKSTAIRCEFLYQSQPHAISEGAILYARDFPAYFRSLQQRRIVAIVDVEGDPSTQEFRESYFKPLGITSMLDAPIYQGGEVVGVVCHEQTGPMRNWTAQQCEFATAVGDAVGRLHEEAAHSLAERRLNSSHVQIVNLQRLSDFGRLAAGMAHDFNNVLQAVLGYADDITDLAQEQPHIRAVVEKLVAAAERGSYLARELLVLGSEPSSRPRVVGLRDVIETCRDMLGKAAGPTVSLDVLPMNRASRIFVDPGQLERVVLNLVVNARDAMPSGGTITISSNEERGGSDRDAGAFVVLDISDTGLGMDADTRARMFEPLFTTKGDKGTGLGLAIVQQIVTLAGGSIDVRTALGAGTSIRVFLPKIA